MPMFRDAPVGSKLVVLNDGSPWVGKKLSAHKFLCTKEPGHSIGIKGNVFLMRFREPVSFKTKFKKGVK